MQHILAETKINSHLPLIAPQVLFNQLPASCGILNQVQQFRATISNIISGQDKRLLVVVGPCSIHEKTSALEYAQLLKAAADRFADDLFIVMRVYFEKPRTLLGWKGLISDPHLDGTYDIHHGLYLAREILLQLSELQLPCATEFLDAIIPQYLGDLISWSAVGARTSASQLHRELASGLAMPIGFKNTTDGNVKTAVDAVSVAQCAHQLLSINTQGQTSILKTSGNPNCHIVLRGSNNHSNYSSAHIQLAEEMLKTANLNPQIMIDCSHGNSMKEYQQQATVIKNIIEQWQQGRQSIFGVMLESFLMAGKQSIDNLPRNYGQSVTDACLSWGETVPLLEKLAFNHRMLCRHF